MYHIILIDDEEIAIEALKKSVNWDQYGIDTILSANSMQTAKRAFQQQPVDIMVCDIEMPNGSGFDILHWVNENYPDCICIFLTCHANFSYARDAISLGVFEYLLKPAAARDIEDVMKRAIARVKEVAAINRTSADLIVLTEHSVDLNEPNISKVKKAEIIVTVKDYINANLGHDITREEFADLVFLSPDYLSRLFKRETGLSISDYIYKKRIAAAGELLVQSDLSVSKIADSVGYAYLAYFSKMFKKETGFTPQEYRKRYKSW